MQKLFTTFRAAVESFPLGESKVGLFRPGRYNGFCTMNPQPGMQVEIFHVNNPLTSIQKTPNSEAEQFGPFGAILMPSGVVIHEDGAIYVTPDSNANLPLRRDLLICDHAYTDVVGGTPATYLIIKGPPGGALPALPNVTRQIIIGHLEIPAGAINSNGIVWVPRLPSLPGDMTPQQLWNLINVPIPDATITDPGLTQFATIEEVTGREVTDKVVSPGSLQYMAAGVYVPEEEIGDNPQQLGLTLYADDFLTDQAINPVFAISPLTMRKHSRKRDPIYHTGGSTVVPQSWNGQTVIINGDSGVTPVVTLQLPNTLSRNFMAVIIPNTQQVKFVVIGNAPTPVIKLPNGYLAESQDKNQSMILENISAGAPVFQITNNLKKSNPNVSSGLVPMRAAVPYFPEDNSLAEFDATGKGISGDVIGWAICNGQNGTRDLTGRFLVQRDPSLSAIDTVGDTGGSNTVTLTAQNLPPHQHDIEVVGQNTDGSPYQVVGVRNSNVPGSAGSTLKTKVENNTPSAIDIRPRFYTTIYIQRVL